MNDELRQRVHDFLCELRDEHEQLFSAPLSLDDADTLSDLGIQLVALIDETKSPEADSQGPTLLDRIRNFL